MTSPNEAVQVGALKIMLEATAKLADTLVLPEIMGKLDALEEQAKRVKLI